MLERAHQSEPDAARKQQILFALGDVYAQVRRVDLARLVFADLATQGVNAELRTQATARFAAMLGI
jgi:hypothetical protein